MQQLANAHRRVANIRRNALHQATSLLTKTKSAIVLEDLNVQGMLRNHHLAQAIADVGFHEFRRQLTYKGQWYGCQIIVAAPFFPSSKRCSHCGCVKPHLSLGERVYVCAHCGQQLDRDLNAARNLEQLATGSSSGSRTPDVHNACGENVSPGLQAVLAKQEPNCKLPLCRFV